MGNLTLVASSFGFLCFFSQPLQSFSLSLSRFAFIPIRRHPFCQNPTFIFSVRRQVCFFPSSSLFFMDRGLQAVVAALATFVAVTLFISLSVLVCKRWNQRTQRRRSEPRAQTWPRPVTEISSITVDESRSFDPYMMISLAELATATKNFSPDLIVGDGSFGLVYKAVLSNDVVVAVKKLDPDAFQGFREFRAEMETLGKLRHPNLVKILGYYASGSDRLLVYEFMVRGSLDYWLHDTFPTEHEDSSGLRLPLSWEARTKIVKGVANGLCYLHGLEKPIIHRDIKASNVLLDSEFEAHIADFGLARRIDNSHSHVSTQVAGTIGYMPPEYREGITVATVKADVYSFGMLMLETGTGQRPNLPVVLDRKDVGLVEWARLMMARNDHMKMLDIKILQLGLDEEKVKEYFEIACKCTCEIPKERPVMLDILEMLSRI